jgi:hypothetical protein
MPSRVLCLTRQHLEIVRRVVPLVSVDVMHYFLWLESSAESLCCYLPMQVLSVTFLVALVGLEASPFTLVRRSAFLGSRD